MDVSIAIAKTIRKLLERDGWWPPNDVNKVMGTDYLYDQRGLYLFLEDIKKALRPALVFTFDAAFAKTHLNSSVSTLTGAIEQKTKPADPSVSAAKPADISGS